MSWCRRAYAMTRFAAGVGVTVAAAVDFVGDGYCDGWGDGGGDGHGHGGDYCHSHRSAIYV